MKITELEVYDLDKTLKAVTLPMSVRYPPIADTGDEINRGLQRLEKLSNNPCGTGHDNALSGILVAMNVTATVKWWEQFQRYHFKQIVSSQSTMHKLRAMITSNSATFAQGTNPEIVRILQRMASNEKVTTEELAYSCPMGLELTARVTTNYLQLKTMYFQRRTHKLKEWRDFCEMIRKLPYADVFIVGK